MKKVTCPQDFIDNYTNGDEPAAMVVSESLKPAIFEELEKRHLENDKIETLYGYALYYGFGTKVNKTKGKQILRKQFKGRHKQRYIDEYCLTQEVKDLIVKANSGDGEAAYEVAFYYRDGTHGLDYNIEEFVFYLELACDKGYVPAYRQLLNYITRIRKEPYDEHKVRELTDRLLTIDEIEGKIWEAFCCFNGVECEYDVSRGLDLFLEVAENGDLDVGGSIPFYVINGAPHSSKVEAFYNDIVRRAEEGDVQANLHLLLAYENIGFLDHIEECMACFRNTLKSGHPAIHYLHYKFWSCLHEEKMTKGALKELEAAASMGHTEALCDLSEYLFKNGEIKRAEELMIQAASLDSDYAYGFLGEIYGDEEFEGVKHSPRMAIKMLESMENKTDSVRLSIVRNYNRFKIGEEQLRNIHHNLIQPLQSERFCEEAYSLSAKTFFMIDAYDEVIELYENREPMNGYDYYLLGASHLMIDKDKKQALEYFKKGAMDYADPYCAEHAGRILFEISEPGEDISMAIEFLRLSYRAGHTDCALYIARIAASATDWVTAAFYYQECLEKGKVVPEVFCEILYALFIAYGFGYGVKKNIKKSHEFLELLKNMDPEGRAFEAEYKLVGMAGFKIDRKEAIELASSCLDGEYPTAYNTLGIASYYGYECPKDRQKALEYFGKGAAQGNQVCAINKAITLMATDPSIALMDLVGLNEDYSMGEHTPVAILKCYILTKNSGDLIEQLDKIIIMPLNYFQRHKNVLEHNFFNNLVEKTVLYHIEHNPEDYRYIARAYECGVGYKKDKEKTYEYLYKSYKAGNIESGVELALLKIFGFEQMRYQHDVQKLAGYSYVSYLRPLGNPDEFSEAFELLCEIYDNGHEDIFYVIMTIIELNLAEPKTPTSRRVVQEYYTDKSLMIDDLHDNIGAEDILSDVEE